jgi:hypothetical protein
MLTRSLHILSLAVLALGAPATAVAQGGVPTLNVTATCRNIPADMGGINRDPAACLKSENDARDTLAKEWAGFSAADRVLCTQTATMAGTASYVQLLTCLELQRDARNMPKDELTQTRR